MQLVYIFLTVYGSNDNTQHNHEHNDAQPPIVGSSLEGNHQCLLHQAYVEKRAQPFAAVL